VGFDAAVKGNIAEISEGRLMKGLKLEILPV